MGATHVIAKKQYFFVALSKIEKHYLGLAIFHGPMAQHCHYREEFL